MKMAETNNNGANHQSDQGSTMLLEAISLNVGSNAHASAIPNTKEMMLKTTDSVRNWFTRLFLKAPIVFLSPTSLALLADFAVERLMKLIIAKSNTKMAMAANNQTNFMSPCFSPSCIFRSDFK